MWPFEIPLFSAFPLHTILLSLASSNPSICKTSSFFFFSFGSDRIALGSHSAGLLQPLNKVSAFIFLFVLIFLLWFRNDSRNINPRNCNLLGFLGFLSSKLCLGVRNLEFLSFLFFHLVVLCTVWMLRKWGRNGRSFFFCVVSRNEGKVDLSQSGCCVRCSWVVGFAFLGLNF